MGLKLMYHDLLSSNEYINDPEYGSRAPNININFKYVMLTPNSIDGMHWHNCLQFSLIKKGSLVYNVNQDSYTVEEGQGFFVNYGYLHKVSPNEDKTCEYFVVNVDPKFIFGIQDDFEKEKYLTPYITNAKLAGLILSSNVTWQNEILNLLGEVERAFSEKYFGYELAIRSYLGNIWLIFITELKDTVQPFQGRVSTDKERIKALINYVRMNYMKNITLSDIASVVNISEGECCRLFKRTIQSSPIKYRNSYRIEQSLKLLIETRDTITQISEEVGFASVSYYISLFKKQMQCTPKEFRKKYLTGSYAGPFLTFDNKEVMLEYK